jgi:hypothetical protein
VIAEPEDEGGRCSAAVEGAGGVRMVRNLSLPDFATTKLNDIVQAR